MRTVYYSLDEDQSQSLPVNVSVHQGSALGLIYPIL